MLIFSVERKTSLSFSSFVSKTIPWLATPAIILDSRFVKTTTFVPIIFAGSYDLAIPLTIDLTSFPMSIFSERSFLDFWIFEASRIVPILKLALEKSE